MIQKGVSAHLEIDARQVDGIRGKTLFYEVEMDSASWMLSGNRRQKVVFQVRVFLKDKWNSCDRIRSFKRHFS